MLWVFSSPFFFFLSYSCEPSISGSVRRRCEGPGKSLSNDRADRGGCLLLEKVAVGRPMLTQHPTGSSPSSLSATPHSRTSALQALQAPNERQPNQLPHTAGELSVLLPARAPCGPARELCWGQVNLTFPRAARAGGARGGPSAN